MIKLLILSLTLFTCAEITVLILQLIYLKVTQCVLGPHKEVGETK